MVVEGDFWCFMGVFEGCFGKSGVQNVVFCGEVVVDCVVNVDKWHHVVCGLKMGHLVEIYFGGDPIWDV